MAADRRVLAEHLVNGNIIVEFVCGCEMKTRTYMYKIGFDNGKLCELCEDKKRKSVSQALRAYDDGIDYEFLNQISRDINKKRGGYSIESYQSNNHDKEIDEFFALHDSDDADMESSRLKNQQRLRQALSFNPSGESQARRRDERGGKKIIINGVLINLSEEEAANYLNRK